MKDTCINQFAYNIRHDLEYKESCDRCGVPLMHAIVFFKDGKQVIVGRECAKYYGIIWTEKVGPMADDPETYQKAIEVFKAKKADRAHGYRWPGGWEACQLIKESLGSIAWNKAMREANK